MHSRLDVTGIGNALVDVLVDTDDEAVRRWGLSKGSMALVEMADAERIHDELGNGVERSGGSAANTVAGLARLGLAVGFMGVVAADRLGEVFVAGLEELGVHVAVRTRSTGSTGRSLILVTPDAERTMCTSLGVNEFLSSDDLDPALLSSTAVTYLEGYLFDKPEAKDALRHAISTSHGAGGRVAMTLSDPFCVERHRADFAALVAHELDLVLGNAEEFCTLTGHTAPEAALEAVRRPGLTVSLTLGADGALVAEGKESVVAHLPAQPVARVVDTTGAGDLYAAGFLFGWVQHHDPPTCALLGAVTAAEVISHIGARPEADLRALAEPLLAGAPNR